MGLEMVELSILVEQEFGIRIADEDYERLKTVGDLERYVVWKIGQDASGWPRSQLALLRGFCQFRREIIRQTGIARTSLRPSTRLQQHWRTLQEWRATRESLSAVLEVPLPAWNVEGWMVAGCLGTLFSPLIAIACFAADASMLWVPVSVLICWVLGAAGAFRMAENRFEEATLASVAREACLGLSQRQAKTRPPSTRYAEGDVMSRIVVLLSENFSVPIDEIHPESRFVEDLMFG